MGMGGTMKGHSPGNRGRSYGLVLVLAFGVAILGVLVVHKLRERRTFTTLIKEKDQQLFALQLSLQRERDQAKEAKRKAEEMKAKMYSLRTQKMELSIRLLEMHSTIASLKHEQQTAATTLQEKQTQIKLLMQKMEQRDSNRQNPQVRDRTEEPRHKEAENGDLKGNVQLPVKVRSVSSDDPSNPPVNATRNASSRQSKEDGGIVAEEQIKKHGIFEKGGNEEHSQRGEDSSDPAISFGEGAKYNRNASGVGNTGKAKVKRHRMLAKNNRVEGKMKTRDGDRDHMEEKERNENGGKGEEIGTKEAENNVVSAGMIKSSKGAADSDSDQAKVAQKYEESEQSDVQETETYSFRESKSKLEEDGEEYKEETNEV